MVSYALRRCLAMNVLEAFSVLIEHVM